MYLCRMTLCRVGDQRVQLHIENGFKKEVFMGYECPESRYPFPV